MISFKHLTPNVLVTLGGIFSILVFATLISFLFRKKKNFSEVFARIRSWWVIACLVCGSLLMAYPAPLILFSFVSFIAFKEYLSLIPTRRADRRVLFWGYLAIPIHYYLVYLHWYQTSLIFIPIYMFLFLPIRMALDGETKNFLKAVSTIHWGLMITVFSLSHVVFFMGLSKERNPQGGGAGLILYLILLTELNDVAQYIWGKSFGKNAIVPKISPNKTVEGFLGGVVTTTLISYLISPFLTPLRGEWSLVYGALLSVCGFFGDVTLSAIKRDVGVKDSGTLLPGHGGILDRVDSLTYTAPIFFHVINFFYYQ